jgi:hypothetical protein
MADDRGGPDPDRLLVARLDAIARRNARWGDLTEAQKAGGAAELREVAGDRADLLAEVAGLNLGTTKSKAPSTGRWGMLWQTCAAWPAPMSP